MLRDLSRLVTRDVVVPAAVAIFACLLVGGAMLAAVGAPKARLVTLAVVGGMCFLALLWAGLTLRFRYCELCKGHCPNPLCRGVVQRSDLARRGFVVCPTCRRQWPKISHIDFKATSRQW